MQVIENKGVELCRKTNHGLAPFSVTQKLLRVRGKQSWMEQLNQALTVYGELDQQARQIRDGINSSLSVRIRIVRKRVNLPPCVPGSHVSHQYLLWYLDSTKNGKRTFSSLKWGDVINVMNDANLTLDERRPYYQANLLVINLNEALRAAVQQVCAGADALHKIMEMGDTGNLLADFVQEA